MQELLTSFKGATVFSTLDLAMGYYQIPMDADSQKYTSFIINSEQYEFVRMPFGLKNAPMIFQVAMNRVLGHLSFTKVYLDDIIIFSNT